MRAANCGRCKTRLFSGVPVDVTQTAFEKHARATKGVALLVDVWAAWCGPCKAMAPAFAKAAGVLEPNVRLLKLDADQAPRVMAAHSISSIPTLLLYRDGRLIERSAGAMTADQIVAWARQGLAKAGVKA